MGRSTSERQPAWPEGKKFAFTVFDDPDYQTVARAGPVYELLAECGIRTTKGVWVGPPGEFGGTCHEPGYRDWTLGLKARGFEIGWHGATFRSSTREETAAGLEQFREWFGEWPRTMTQHVDCGESVYWGPERLSGARRLAYLVLSRGKTWRRFHGSEPGHPYYWADLCRRRIQYVRNFVFHRTNTLAVCPFMPYHDPARPEVNYWFASSEARWVRSFNERISEAEQDRLEEEGGACILYTHFAYEFTKKGVLDARFRRLIERLAQKRGWFVPVSTLLDFLLAKNGVVTIGAGERRKLERRWLADKVRYGTE